MFWELDTHSISISKSSSTFFQEVGYGSCHHFISIEQKTGFQIWLFLKNYEYIRFMANIYIHKSDEK